MQTVIPVIIAGGGGTRLWPLSRQSLPKQFLALLGETSLLQRTLQRRPRAGADQCVVAPVVICNRKHRFLVAEQARASGQALQEILLEPVGRNTAPALTAAALRLAQEDPILVVMPADHHIGDDDGMAAALTQAVAVADSGAVVTLGVTPGWPETGYGYIRHGGEGANEKNAETVVPRVFSVDEFVEKPNQKRAQQYLAAGNYLWNSGIFVLRSSVWLRAIATCRRPIIDAVRKAVEQGKTEAGVFVLDESSFAECPPDSIDYAVMEKIIDDPSYNVRVVALDAGWSDIGSWPAVWAASAKDRNGNVTIGDVITESSNDSLVISRSRLVTVLGCNNTVVVETADAVLVAALRAGQDVRKVVERLQANDRGEASDHRQVHRPWGSYESLLIMPGYQIKRLRVNPGKQLSLQLHHQRSEHWVVVRGRAAVVLNEEKLQLAVNESVFIPAGARHRLTNNDDGVLEVIEVQVGSYLGEDDIVRFEDDFGRVP